MSLTAKFGFTMSLAVLILAALFPARAQPRIDPAKSITQLRHEVWGTREGLPQNTVPAIAQTRDGYLWVGTELGLARFDGLRFTVFDKSNTPELKSNEIYALLEDRAGNLWIGTNGGGLTRLRDGKFQSFGVHEGLSSEVVQFLYEDRSGAIWIGTGGGGLDRLSGGQFTAYTSKDGLADDTVFSIAEDAAGDLWIGTHGGLSRLSHGRITSYGTEDGLPSDYIRCLYPGREGVWIGTNGGGLARWRDGKFTVYGKREGLTAPAISSLQEDGAGTLWIGSVGAGLIRYAEGRFDSYTSKDGLSSDDIWRLYLDRDGDLWIGTGGGGLNRLEDARFTPYGVTEGLSSDVVLPVYEDREGAIWMGTNGGGLNRLRDGKIAHFTTADGLADGLVFTVCEDRPGSLWIGTRKGLNHLENGKFTKYTMRDGLPSDKVVASYVDRQGVLWLGTRAGLTKFENGQFTTYTTRDGMSNNYVLAIEEDRHGALWIGTAGGGLDRLEDGRFEVFDSARGISNGVVWAIHEDADGAIWAGTNGGGLNRLKNGKFTSFTTRQGLFDDAIFRILEDAAGNLWMSSNRGIFRAARRELNELAEGKRRSVETFSYGTEDGMRSSECNGGIEPAGWKARDGRMWFPTMKGVVVFDPSAAEASGPAPPVLLEQALIGSRAVDLHGYSHAPPGSGQLEFRYAAIGFRSPGKTVFRYKLEGFDPDWVDAGTRRTAYYTNIPPGDYRFRVLAHGAEGAWTASGASLGFSLAPHFYQTTWFLAVCGLGAIGLASAAHSARVRHVHAKERLRTQVARERADELMKEITERQRVERDLVKAKDTAERANRVKSEFLANMSHEIRTPVNGMLGMTELALESELTAEQRDYLTTARTSAESLLSVVNDILDYSKIEAGKLELDPIDFELYPLLEEAIRSLSFFAGQKGIELICDIPPSVPEFVRGDAARLRQIVLNLLGNAVKFTERGEVILRVESGPRVEESVELRFEVSDTGIGIPANKQNLIFEAFSQADNSMTRRFGGTGLGLTISSRLVHMMGGRIWVNSKMGEGSQFHFTVRLQSLSRVVPREAHPEALAGLRALVADRNSSSRRVLTEMLESWGMSVVSAETAQAAFEALRSAGENRYPFALSLLNADMQTADGISLVEMASRIGVLGRAVILASACRPGDATTARQLGAAAYLTKPVRRKELREALLRAIGHAQAGQKSQSASPFAQTANPLRILLAEDNPVNQRVAIGALKRRGHSVVVANNGREALEALDREAIDVVLMDIQMPLMDGLEATAAIRAKERQTGRRVPIVALTAHAIRGDERTCLDAGMDAYLSKPIQPARLFEIVEQIQPGSHVGAA